MPVTLTVIFDVMTLPDDFPGQLRIALDAQSYAKKAGLRPVSGKLRQDLRRHLGVGPIVNGNGDASRRILLRGFAATAPNAQGQACGRSSTAATAVRCTAVDAYNKGDGVHRGEARSCGRFIRSANPKNSPKAWTRWPSRDCRRSHRPSRPAVWQPIARARAKTGQRGQIPGTRAVNRRGES